MRIIVGTDGSDAAQRAIEFAARLATDLGGGLKIVNIVHEYDVPPEQLLTFARQEHVSSQVFQNEVSRQTLQVAERRATELGMLTVRSESQRGDAAKSIIEIARRDEADMIVLGKRGLGPLSGLLLGSVSQKVVSMAPCAVIVVP